MGNNKVSYLLTHGVVIKLYIGFMMGKTNISWTVPPDITECAVCTVYLFALATVTRRNLRR